MPLHGARAHILARGRLVAHFLALELGLLLIALGAFRLTHPAHLTVAVAVADARADWLIIGSGALFCLLALWPRRNLTPVPSPLGEGNGDA